MSYSTQVPLLEGYSFPQDDIEYIRKKGGLLSMRTELSHVCNYKCLYCNEGHAESDDDIITPEMIISTISQVKELGGKSVVVIGGGEPTLYPKFTEIIEYISQSGLIPVVITNGSMITPDLAQWLFGNNTSILLKLDSLNATVQDKLAGTKGAFELIQKALNNFIDVGYTNTEPNRLKLGLSFVSTRMNYSEIPNIWRYCRSNNIYPNHELLILRGRAFDEESRLELSKEKVIELKTSLLEIDQNEYGLDWLPYKPLTSTGCQQVYYSVYLDTKGFIRPCADIDIEYFNISEASINNIINTDFFRMVRNIENYLQGKCRICEYHYECIGCRGSAYVTGLNKGLPANDAIVCEDPYCWKH